MEKTFNDYDPEETDFCTNTPGYSFRHSGIYTGGEYSITPNSFETVYDVTLNTIDFTSQEGIELGYFPEVVVNENDSRVKYSLGCRYFILRVDFGEGNTFLRVFENVEDFDLWYH